MMARGSRCSSTFALLRRFKKILAAGILVLGLLISSCGPVSVAQETSRPTTPLAAAPREHDAVHSVARAGSRRVEADALWERTYRGQAAVSISADGRLVITHGSLSSRLAPGIEVFDSAGTRLWTFGFPSQGARISQAAIHGREGRVVATTRSQDQTGRAWVFTPSGQLLWSRSLDGPTSVYVSDDSSRMAFHDHLSETLVLTDGEGRELGSIRLASGGQASFPVGSPWLLAHDRRRVALVDRGGSVAWRMDTGTDIKVAVSRDGGAIALTTADTDSAVYMFDGRGRLIWNHLLPLGGTNRVTFGPDDQTLYLYDVGDRGSIYALDPSSGTVRWRAAFEAPSGLEGKVAGLRAPEGDRVWIHYTEGSSGAGGDPLRHILALLGPEGQLLGHLALGSDLDLKLSRDGSAAAAAYFEGKGSRSPVTRVRYYDLAGLLSQIRGG